ncbi:ogr/Delta-like zinc finger family protein [Vibrio scophthalmi]|uniref:ogr/Delta-like zinc finger family protein n=1 Tax=Vibrio scophthalmi TaxID=45658 RepID=UPI0009F5F10D|nr:ogr/Delta-like zinc finger family protein [Vibrio scophthalmi]
MDCPTCHCRSATFTSKSVSDTTRETYHQCKNLNCSTVFVTHTTLSHIVTPTGAKPDPEIQPDLYKILKSKRNRRTTTKDCA